MNNKTAKATMGFGARRGGFYFIGWACILVIVAATSPTGNAVVRIQISGIADLQKIGNEFVGWHGLYGQGGDIFTPIEIASTSSMDMPDDDNAAIFSLDTKTTVEVESVTLLTPHTIEVKFNVEMQETALDPLNYTISGPGQGTFSTHPNSVNGSADTYVLVWECPELMTGDEEITITVNPTLRSLTDLPMGDGNFGSDTAMAVLPVITLLGNASVTVECATVYEDDGAMAADACDGDLTAEIVADDNVNTSVVGSYAVTYNVSDDAANAALEIVRTVNVVDTTAPIITLIADDSGKYENVGMTWGGEDSAVPTLISEISDVPWTPSKPGARPKVIYGEDDRIDVYQETDAQRLEWAAATCALIKLEKLTQHPDGSWTIPEPGAYRRSDLPPCTGEPFADQPTAAYCTGFMVGSDLIATAGHCYSTASISGVRFVFGFWMLDETTPRLDFLESEVYQGVEVVSCASSGSYDHSIVRVDRPITAPGATAFTPRREGVIQPGEYVGVIGHPSGLPMKIAFGDTYVRSSDQDGYFVANLDTYGGNSGSPVINTYTGLLEGILVRGATDFLVDYENNCFYSNVYPSDEGRGEDVTKATVFASSIPSLGTESMVECGDIYLDIGATAWDDCDGDITANIVTVDTVDTDVVGVYTVAYNVSDAAANAASQALRWVYVLDTLPPELYLGDFDPAMYDEDGYLFHEYNEPFSEPADFLAFDVCEGDLGLPQADALFPGTVFAAAWALDNEGQLQWVVFSDTERVPDARTYDAFMLAPGDYLLGYIAMDSEENIHPELDEYGLPALLYNDLDGSSDFLDNEGNLKPEIDFARLVRVVKTTPMTVFAVGDTQFTKPIGDSVTFAVAVTDEIGPLAYQWYRITHSKTHTLIPDAVESTYSIFNITKADVGDYQCHVYDNGADESAWSPVFTLFLVASMPISSTLGLALAALAAALIGAAAVKRRV